MYTRDNLRKKPLTFINQLISLMKNLLFTCVDIFTEINKLALDSVVF